MMEDPLDIDIDFDNSMDGTLIITCPQCQNKIRRKFKGLRSGTEISCKCGTSIEIADDEFISVQKSLDDLKQSFSKFSI